MTRYRKRPVEVEAFRLGFDAYPDWFKRQMALGKVSVDWKNTNAKILTLEGEMEASHGDYVIQGVNGELYPCKAEISSKPMKLFLTPAPSCRAALIECAKRGGEATGLDCKSYFPRL